MMARYDPRAKRICNTAWPANKTDKKQHQHRCAEVHSQKELDHGVTHRCTCGATKWES
jgi:hypothetical protein